MTTKTVELVEKNDKRIPTTLAVCFSCKSFPTREGIRTLRGSYRAIHNTHSGNAVEQQTVTDLAMDHDKAIHRGHGRVAVIRAIWAPNYVGESGTKGTDEMIDAAKRLFRVR